MSGEAGEREVAYLFRRVATLEARLARVLAEGQGYRENEAHNFCADPEWCARTQRKGRVWSGKARTR